MSVARQFYYVMLGLGVVFNQRAFFTMRIIGSQRKVRQ
jgi:hypothetical protein